MHAARPGRRSSRTSTGCSARAPTSPACTSTSTSSPPWAATRPRNAPHYGDNLGPQCYSIPFRGISLNDGAGRPRPGAAPAGHKPRTTSAFVGPASESAAGTGQLAAGERADQRARRADPAAVAAVAAGLEQPAGRAGLPRGGGDACDDAPARWPPAGPSPREPSWRPADQVDHLHRGDGAGHDACSAISITNSGVTGTTGYRAVFTDVTGLIVGDDVDIAGVRVGQVTSISVYRQRTWPWCSSRSSPDGPLPASVTAQLFYRNLVGQRYMELAQGTGPVGRALRAGRHDPAGQDHPGAEPDRAVRRVPAAVPGPVPRRRQQAVQRDHPAAPGRGRAPWTACWATSPSLTTALAAKDQVIDQVIDNLNSVVTTINSRGNALAQDGDHAPAAGVRPGRRPPARSARRSPRLGSLTSATAGLLQVGRAPLHQDIVSLGQLATNLANNSPAVQTFLQNLPSRCRTSPGWPPTGRGSTSTCATASVTGVHSAGCKPPKAPDPAARCRHEAALGATPRLPRPGCRGSPSSAR